MSRGADGLIFGLMPQIAEWTLLTETYTSKSLMLAHGLICFQTFNQLLMPLGFLLATGGFSRFAGPSHD